MGKEEPNQTMRKKKEIEKEMKQEKKLKEPRERDSREAVVKAVMELKLKHTGVNVVNRECAEASLPRG